MFGGRSRTPEGSQTTCWEPKTQNVNKLIVGLQQGPLKQELSWQMQRNKRMTFADSCKETGALEQELQDKEDDILSHKVTVPTSR
ncbi:hypothetical protein F2P81_016517 [Scophthalmus maximus]|uniref:Uncharacterized protein n=1 Tax=Scophthalmus maximus TaxID=52904 RepID=A0A6A4SNS0_SCOMX|nr:hypothetical protein F2P81_016517 [Scophthalmus maximus]